MGKLDEPSAMGNWIMNHSGGRIRNEKQANLVLIGLFGLIVLTWLAVVIINQNVEPEPTPETLKQLKEFQNFNPPSN